MDERDFTDPQGFQDEAVYDTQDTIVSDKKLDETGKVIGEGMYKNGVLVGSKKYFIDPRGFST